MSILLWILFHCLLSQTAYDGVDKFFFAPQHKTSEESLSNETLCHALTGLTEV